jgi:predicted nicotinamide N-methyase
LRGRKLKVEEPEAEDVERKMRRRAELRLPDGSVVALRQDFLTCETGGALWDSTVVLCAYLAQCCSVRDLDVLELGSGIGAGAIFAFHLGAKSITATDGDADVLPLLQSNSAPFAGVKTQRLSWGEEAGVVAAQCDLVMGADLIYDRAQHAPLLATVRAAKRFVLVVRSRHETDEKQFLDAMAGQMQLVRCVEGSSLNNAAIDARAIRVYEWKQK